MTLDRIVAARLEATRITKMAGPLSGELPDRYEKWHAELNDRLSRRFTNLEPAPLFVTCTANAQSELLIGEGGRTIVHDQHLGRTLNRMTYFVVRDWPASRVHAWAFERIATAALGRGDPQGTQLALALSAGLKDVDDVPEQNPTLDRARALMVDIQEFFVLAHEVAHTALGEAAHTSLKEHLREELEHNLRQREAVVADNRDAIADQIAQDVAGAVDRYLGATASEEDLKRLRSLADIDRVPNEIDVLNSHRFLYEELACDLIATEITLEHFREIHDLFNLQTVLPAILMALHHLTSLEYLRIVGSPNNDSISQTLQAAMIRKSVWRDMTRQMHEAECPDSLGELYLAVTQDHAHKLGDQVLFIVPVTWNRAQETLATQSSDRSSTPDLAMLREAVWKLARPGHQLAPPNNGLRQ